MRCVRFSDEIAGKNEIGGLFRGGEKIITNSDQGPVTSNLSGNMIDLCPVGALTSKPAKYTYRTWELTKNETVDVLDSILPSTYTDTKDDKVIRIRARENEAINQEWISDLTRFSYDGLYTNRLVEPTVNGQAVTWHKAFDEILEDLHEVNPKNIAALVGNGLAVEDIYSFKEFMKLTAGSNNIDYANKPALKEFNKANVTFENTIADIDNADAILFVGTDLDNHSPVLNSRIFQQTSKRKVEVFNIGAELKDYAYAVKELGTTPQVLLDEQKALNKALDKAKNAVIFVDVEEVLTRTDAAGILAKLDEMKEQFSAKLNFFTKSAGLINAVDVMPNTTDMNYKQITKALEHDEIDILFVYGSQDIDAKLARKAKNLVYIGTHENELSKAADIVLPTATFTEKNSLWNNVEGRIVEVKAVTMPYQEARVDWKIWRALSEFVGEKLPFDNLNELREKLAVENNSYKTENIGLIVKPEYIVDKKATTVNKKDLENSKVKVKFTNEISKNSKFYK
tara:strand:- start:556 stop:2088 length:1533 start_codon:yes stop_codon:yes gene_type:complete